MYGPEGNMRLLSLTDTWDSGSMLSFNYGNLDIYKTKTSGDSEIVVKASIRDIDG